MFAPQAASGAVASLGKAMSRAGANLRSSASQSGGGTPSPRQYRKIMQTAVDAHRQFSEIDTEHHGRRLQQQTESALKLGEAGFHTIRQTTPFGSTEVQKDPGAGPVGPDRAHNQSADVHGAPGPGHTTVHGYTGDVITLSPRAVSGSTVFVDPKSIGSSNVSQVKPMELEGGKVSEPTKPVFKAGGGTVVKSGSFMDKPDKPQPEVPGKLKTDGAIVMGSSATKGKMKGPKLKKSPDSGKLTEAGWEAKLSGQEAAYLATRKAKLKDNN